MKKVLEKVIIAGVAFAGLTVSSLAHSDPILATFGGMYHGNGANNGANNGGHSEMFFEDEATQSWQLADQCASRGAYEKRNLFEKVDKYGLNLDCLVYSIVESNSNTFFYRFSSGTSTPWNKWDKFLSKLYAANPNIKVYGYFSPDGWIRTGGGQHQNMPAIASQIATLAQTNPNLAGMALDDWTRVADWTKECQADANSPSCNLINKDYDATLLNSVSTNLDGGTRDLRLLVTAYWHGELLRSPAELDEYETNCSTGQMQPGNGGCYSFDGIILPLLSYNANMNTIPPYKDVMPTTSEVGAQLSTIKQNLLPYTSLYTLFYATGIDSSRNSTPSWVTSMGYYTGQTTNGMIMWHNQTDNMAEIFPSQSPVWRSKRHAISDLYEEVSTWF